jgi:Flp pilus assembly protein TadG
MARQGREALSRTPDRAARRFSGDRKGALAPAAALVMMPITLLTFGAVEFHRYNNVRNGLQNALDAAALAVARSSSQDNAQLQRTGEAVLRAQVPFNANLRLASFTVDPQDGAVVVDAQGVGHAHRGQPVHVRRRPGHGPSEMARDTEAMEIALVLDNTGSMATNNRIGIARTAATNFVTLMENATGNRAGQTSVRIGLVPFAATVNVGPSYQGQAWLDPHAQSPVHSQLFSTALGQPTAANRWTLLRDMQIPWGGCVESRPMPFDIQETAPDSATPATLFVPYFYPDETDHIPSAKAAMPDNFRFWGWDTLAPAGIQPNAPSNQWVPDLVPAFENYNGHPVIRSLGGLWSGFVVDVKPVFWTHAQDRDNIYADFWAHVNGDFLTPQKVVGKYTKAAVDIEVAAGRFNRASKSQGPNKSCDLPPLTRLTTDTGAVKTSIAAMTAQARNTNVPMGLVWGWHLLSPHGPFQDGGAYDPKVRKIIVLMTDGENSISTAATLNGAEYSGIGYPWQNRIGVTDAGQTSGGLNNRLSPLCTNIKKAGIVLYTIRVEVTGANTLLQACATDAGKAFDVKQASELDSAFRAIGASIQQLRIAS